VATTLTLTNKNGEEGELDKMLRIKKIKIMREAISTVYHVEDDGCIQEFNTLKGAEDFVKHIREINNRERKVTSDYYRDRNKKGGNNGVD
tara:strand:+ start:1447 stop:1716 length:270 start_codon:yes stop_codon:yes gene_type:complete